MNEQILNIIVNLKNNASKELGAFSSKIQELQPTFKSMAKGGAIAFGSISTIVGLTTKAFADSESQLARVDQTIKNIDLTRMNSSFDVASKRARDFGSSLQSLSGISDEAGAESFAKLLAITEDYDEAVKLATLSADLSVAKQIDLSSATRLVSQAMTGNTRVLREYGIELKDGASKQEIIGALMSRVGGQSEAFGKTLAGQSAILKQTFGDLQEEIGRALVPAITGILQAVQPVIEKFIEWAKKNPELLRNIILVSGAISGMILVIGTLGLVIPSIMTGFGALIVVLKAVGVAMLFLATNPIGLIIVAIAGLIALVYQLITNWEWVKEMAISIWTSISDFFTGWWTGLSDSTQGWLMLIFNILTGGLLLWVKLFTDNWDVIRGTTVAVWESLATFFTDLWSRIKITFTEAIDYLISKIQPLLDMIDKVVGGVKSVGGKISNTVGSVKEKTGNFLKKTLSVNDAIISPNGNIITTNPKDYLIATKRPQDLAGGGVSHIHLNIDGREVANVVYNQMTGDLLKNIKLA
jgi:hypothetical protein